MYCDFRKDKLDSVLKKHKGLRRLLSPKMRTIPCPYDGITFYTDRSITPEFFMLVRPAMFRLADADRRYRFCLKHRRFTIFWAPLSPGISQTIIRLNPHKNKYSPAQVLDLIGFIVGDYSDVHVGKFDEKVDLPDRTVEDVVKRLHVPYKRKASDYKEKGETYYFGSRKGQQVKVYNKGKQRGIHKELVRIERTTKYKKDQRPAADDFFLNSRNDILKQLMLVDIDKIDNRTAIKKRLKSSKTFFEGYKLLDDKQKRELKRHPAFIQPLIDLQQVVQDELNEWLDSSPRLFFKVQLDRIKPALDVWWSGKPRHGKIKKFSSSLKLIPQVKQLCLDALGWGTTRSNYIQGGMIHFDETNLTALD